MDRAKRLVTGFFDRCVIITGLIMLIVMHLSVSAANNACQVVCGGDGLRIGLVDDGAVEFLGIGKNVKLNTSKGTRNSGFSAVTYPHKTTYKFHGNLFEKDEKLYFQAISKPADLLLNAEYDSDDGCIHITGTVKDLSNTDRGIDLVYSLPIAAAGCFWHGDIKTKVRIKNGSRYGTYTKKFPLRERGYEIDVLANDKKSDFHSIYPLNCITDESKDYGLAMATAANKPCVYSIEYDSEKEVFEILFRFGFSQSAKNKSIPFSFHIYTVSPQWAFRDALSKYYKIHKTSFESRLPGDGIILEQSLKEEKENNPNWSADYFSYCRTFEGRLKYEDDRHAAGIRSFLYVLPGQQSLIELPKAPADYNEAMQLYNEFEEPDKKMPVRYSNRKPRIKLGALKTSDDIFNLLIWHTFWNGNCVAFPINPDPDLFFDKHEGGKTYTQDLFDHCRQILRDNPTVAGIYTDSYHYWGNYYNYRKEHFEYTDIPLTHDANGNVCIFNTFSHYEWNKALKSLADEFDDYTAGNGMRPYQMFNAFVCDVLHVEDDAWDNFAWARAIAYHKPFHISLEKDKSRSVVESFLKHCALYGHLPSRMDPESRYSYSPTYDDLMKKYIPAIQRLSFLGWEPVTHAVSSNSDVKIERFGPRDGIVEFAVYNESDKAVSATISFDTTLAANDKKAMLLMNRHEIDWNRNLKIDLKSRQFEIIELK